jgi:rhomboid protease GluP
MTFLLAVVIVLGVVWRAMTPEERLRRLRTAQAALKRAKESVALTRPECEEFLAALKTRTPIAFVTPALAALNVAIFAAMLFGAGTLSDPETLIGSGASFGPRTTNGEWWRLGTAMFIHSGMLHLLVNVITLVQIGFILERMVGPLVFVAAYVAAGIFAGLVNLSALPMGATGGASGAIFGLYGLLLASTIWGLLQRSSVRIPLTMLKRIAPATAIFVLYNVMSDDIALSAELTGGVAGLALGIIAARGLDAGQSRTRLVAATMGAALVFAVAAAVPLRGITDARSEISRVVTIEDSTVSVYEEALERFKKGRITAEALAQLIDRAIIPELQAADARLQALDRVPQEQQPLVATAEEYVRLRSDSWRFRAEGLRKSGVAKPREDGGTEQASNTGWRRRVEAQHRTNNLTLGKAEEAERASLGALEKIRR